MGKVLITRKGGAVGTKTPTITFVSKTETTIVFTLTNNDSATADVFWEVGDTTPDENSVELASGATSGNITASGLTGNTTYTITAFANAAGKAGSGSASITQTTDVPVTYINATGGTTNTYQDGSKFYKSHTFTSSGNFVVNSLSNQAGKNDIDYLIIAGGGGAGVGGGGAGGYRTTLGTSGGNSSAESKITVTAQTYSVIVGGGGSGVATGENNLQGFQGNNSSALGITSTGGGAGGGSVSDRTTRNGGSGGGGRNGSDTNANLGGLGIDGQGNDGGRGFDGVQGGGGGGGAGQQGGDAPNDNGGDGLSNTLRTGNAETRAGGGGAYLGVGGTGGGGDGDQGSSSASGEAGAVNTGSGGGGNSYASSFGTSGSGGSGIVIIRYEVGSL